MFKVMLEIRWLFTTERSSPPKTEIMTCGHLGTALSCLKVHGGTRAVTDLTSTVCIRTKARLFIKDLAGRIGNVRGGL